MALYLKSGGVWKQATNGGVKIKWGGAWQQASYVYIKGSGAWRDSGYRGYPNPPGAPGVSGWSLSAVNLSWGAAATGGAAVSYYNVVQTDAGGSWINQWNTGNTYLNGIGVSEDQRMRFYVRSVSASGLMSDWGGSVGVQIGHSEQGHYVTDNLTRAWDSLSAGQAEAVNGYRNTTHLRFVPVAVEVSSWYMNLRENPGWAISKISPGTNREVYHIFKNVIQWGTVLDWSEPLVGWFSYVYWGEDNWWGFYVSDNIGWTNSPSGTQRFVGEFRIHGTEHYTQQRYVVDRTAVGNSYW